MPLQTTAEIAVATANVLNSLPAIVVSISVAQKTKSRIPGTVGPDHPSWAAALRPAGACLCLNGNTGSGFRFLIPEAANDTPITLEFTTPRRDSFIRTDCQKPPIFESDDGCFAVSGDAARIDHALAEPRRVGDRGQISCAFRTQQSTSAGWLRRASHATRAGHRS
jgi:hypothetical protein